MALSDYTELQSSIAGWLIRNDLGTVIPDFIRLAEIRIATEFKTQHIITDTTRAKKCLFKRNMVYSIVPSYTV